MTLKEKLKADLVAAMKAKEAEKLSVLRMLATAIQTKEIALRKGEDVVLSDEQVLEVIAAEVKKRKDSVIAYEDGGRADLAEKEKEEIKILEVYLPEQMSDEELEQIVKNTVVEAGSGANFGAIMGKVMGRVKGKADGNRVSAAVKKAMENK
ncbi:MAG: GatB/YqeY domain-containing protein [Patescibacteria group bacterium]|jgi:hypothetical protein